MPTDQDDHNDHNLIPPPPPSLPQEIVFSVTDRHAEFIHDGSPTWSSTYAIRVLTTKGISLERAGRALAELEDALKPVPVPWLIDRLTLVWGVFMATRSSAGDEDAVTAWLGEYLRLLSDLPHDIAALSIDRAIQTARHGFIPSIGEIRTIAEPLVVERQRQRDRLAMTVAAMRGSEA